MRIDLELGAAPCPFLTLSFRIIEQLYLQGHTADNGSSTSIIYHPTLLSPFVLEPLGIFLCSNDTVAFMKGLLIFNTGKVVCVGSYIGVFQQVLNMSVHVSNVSKDGHIT